ncbi:hypothetical protein G6F56_009903 [Rhizopus delemar]|nr:hypothetical protein G6F56_009903 [Rhizopus delemar]
MYFTEVSTHKAYLVWNLCVKMVGTMPNGFQKSAIVDINKECDEYQVMFSVIQVVVDHQEDAIHRLTQVNLILNQDKCHFAQKSVFLLGFQVSADGVNLDKRKVSNAYKWPTPTSGKQIQRFLGFVNYFRDHLVNFSELTHRLDKLRNAGSLEGLWTAQHTKDF